MEINLEEQNGEWVHSFPRRGAIYDLVYTAMSEVDAAGWLRAVKILGSSVDPRAVHLLIDLFINADTEIRLP